MQFLSAPLFFFLLIEWSQEVGNFSGGRNFWFKNFPSRKKKNRKWCTFFFLTSFSNICKFFVKTFPKTLTSKNLYIIRTSTHDTKIRSPPPLVAGGASPMLAVAQMILSNTIHYISTPVKVWANTILTGSSPELSHCGLILRTLSWPTMNLHDEFTLWACHVFATFTVCSLLHCIVSSLGWSHHSSQHAHSLSWKLTKSSQQAHNESHLVSSLPSESVR